MAISSPNLPSTLDTDGDSRSVQARSGTGAIAKRLLLLWPGRLLFEVVRGLLFGLGRLVGEVVKATFMLTLSLVKTVLVVLVILLTLQAAVREIGYAPLVRYVTEEAAIGWYLGVLQVRAWYSTYDRGEDS
jgi:hypothetical protein